MVWYEIVGFTQEVHYLIVVSHDVCFGAFSPQCPN